MGIFVWAHSISYLPVCCGAAEPTDETIVYGTYLHHVGRTVSASTGHIFSHDYIHHRLWLQSVADKKSKGAPKVNLKHFIEYEYNQGVAAFIPPFHNKGFESSLLWSRSKVLKLNTTFHRSSYSPSDCVHDVDSFISWVLSLHDAHPARSYISPSTNHLLTLQNDTLNPNEPKVCTEYLKFIRLKVNINA